MGLYSKHVFPKLLGFIMSSGQMKRLRNRVLSDVKGDVFEIGFGTGLNLPHYPAYIKSLTTADINPGMHSHAQQNVARSHIDVDYHIADGQALPFDEDRFDSVVCTWTLCSIPNAGKALGELYRILKPGGRLYFVEHGLADDPKVQKWQHRLTPIQKKIGDGCHLNRNIRTLLEAQPFSLLELENFYIPNAPKVAGYMYRGIAEKA